MTGVCHWILSIGHYVLINGDPYFDIFEDVEKQAELLVTEMQQCLVQTMKQKLLVTHLGSLQGSAEGIPSLGWGVWTGDKEGLKGKTFRLAAPSWMAVWPWTLQLEALLNPPYFSHGQYESCTYCEATTTHLWRTTSGFVWQRMSGRLKWEKVAVDVFTPGSDSGEIFVDWKSWSHLKIYRNYLTNWNMPTSQEG